MTDGLTEAVDASDTELGIAPLKDAIRAHASHALSDIGDRIVAVSRGHGAQRDDQTVLLIRVV